MNLLQKLEILADSAKYDVACTSSGADRRGPGLGSALPAGCCHSFSADGRCISLLKVLMSNVCVYDCKYCVNRASNDVPRAAFTPEELCELTIQFYRRNYIEGLFLSSGVVQNPDFTLERMIRTLELLRHKHSFFGYIHAKAIPGGSPALINRLGMLADRLSVNIELPSEQSLLRLAPQKNKKAILAPMKQIAQGLCVNRQELALYKNAPRFAPAGQSTQLIIGASPETDFHILKLSASLYETYQLKRIFFSAYIPAVSDSLLPAVTVKPPLLREHRLYQADWLLRFYRFRPDEILSERVPYFDPFLDPKCHWALQNPQQFPVDVNRAPLDALLRVPGIGPTSARRILTARRSGKLALTDLKRIGVVLKRARFFILAADQRTLRLNKEQAARALIDPGIFSFGREQLSFFPQLQHDGGSDSLAAIAEEATLCVRASLR